MNAEESARYKRMVLDLYLAGETSPTTIARILGLNSRTVGYWIERYKVQGVNHFLQDKRHRIIVRNWKIHPDILRQLFLEMRQKKARAYGFCDDIWTLTRVNLVIKQKFGVTYDKKQLAFNLRRFKVPYQVSGYSQDETWKAIRLMCSRTPRDLGIADTEIWKADHVAIIIERQMGHRFHTSHVKKLLRQCGYSVRKINKIRKAAE